MYLTSRLAQAFECMMDQQAASRREDKELRQRLKKEHDDFREKKRQADVE